MKACCPRPAGVGRELWLCVADSCCSWLERQIGFVIQSPLTTQSGHRIIPRCLDRVYRFFDRVLFIDFYRKVPVSIHVLTDVGEYRRYLAAKTNSKVPPSLGVYLHDHHQIAVFLHPES